MALYPASRHIGLQSQTSNIYNSPLPMRVLLLGGTGNLGRRLIPALLAHGHTVIAYVRNPPKLRNIISRNLVDQITVIEGDAFDTERLTEALKDHRCDAIVNTAGNVGAPWNSKTLGKLAASVTSAAIAAGAPRGEPWRAWIIGGLTSLRYPGTSFQIQDYFPAWAPEHHRGTESVMKAIPLDALRWSVLCVGWMYEENKEIDVWPGPRAQELLVSHDVPPGWQDHWVKVIPYIGIYIYLLLAIVSYTTKYEDVADLIAGDLARSESNHIGKFVGFNYPPHQESG